LNLNIRSIAITSLKDILNVLSLKLQKKMATTSSKDKYEHPLVDRYASKEMSYLWSPAKKFSTWRRLWLALAQCQQKLGKYLELERYESVTYDSDAFMGH